MAFLEIMTAIKDQLDENLKPPSGITLHIESMWFPIAETPAIDMRIASATGYEEGLAGFGSHTRYGAFPVIIRARCGMAAAIEGQELLYQLMDEDGPLSIIAALDSDRTLGGNCDSLTWGNGFPWSGIAPYIDAQGNGSLAGSELPVVIVMHQS
jgi:hypothetical protein